MISLFHNPRGYADENVKLDFTNKRLLIERLSDTFLPKFLSSDYLLIM